MRLQMPLPKVPRSFRVSWKPHLFDTPRFTKLHFVEQRIEYSVIKIKLINSSSADIFYEIFIKLIYSQPFTIAIIPGMSYLQILK